MCWKYENEYKTCFDRIEWEDDSDSILGVLKYQYNIDIIDSNKFTREFYNLLTILHEQGIIKSRVTNNE